MVDSVGFVVEKFCKGGDFGKGGFNYVAEFFAGDDVELVGWVKKNGCAGGEYVGTLRASDKFFN